MTLTDANSVVQTTNDESGSNLKIRIIDPADRNDDVLALLQTSMPGDAARWTEGELWQWKHIDNPFGRSLVLISEAEDGRIAGLRAFMRWRFRRKERQFEAFRPVDTATHPDFRRLGIFSKLTMQALEDARRAGGQLIFNTPNGMSINGYLKMGWTQVGVATPMLKVNSYPRTALKIASSKIRKRLGWTAKQSDAAENVPDELQPDNVIDGRFENLIEMHCSWNSDKLATDLSADYLVWRYGDTPLYNYAVFTETEGGVLKGACIVRPARGATLDTVVFEEFVLSAPSERTVGRLIDQAMDVFNPHVATGFAPDGSPVQAFLRKSGFRWSSRSNINFVANPLNENSSPAHARMSDWAISLSELEIF